MAHENLFQNVGKQVEALRLSDQAAAEPSHQSESDTAQGNGDADSEESRIVEEIESLCMNCEENGTTRMLLTKIPFFREIVIMSFYCQHCHFKNSEVQAAGQIQERGCKYALTLLSSADLSRQVVKSDSCTAKFDELGLEIPAGRGQLTNVEGLMQMAVEDLEFQQPMRRSLQPERYEKIEKVITKTKAVLDGSEFLVHFSVDDPAGNSWIEPSPDGKNKNWSRSEYDRTSSQNEALSLSGDQNGTESGTVLRGVERDGGDSLNSEIVPDEVYSFPATCPGCTRPCTTNMKMVDIPHFKQVVLMSTACHSCGYRSNEVKTGGAVPEKGRRITLSVVDSEDLSRDILKSESCVLISSELKLHVEPGTLGGRFTTVEGLLTQVRNDLKSQIFGSGDDINDGPPLEAGDSMQSDSKAKWKLFFADLDAAISGQKTFTIVLQDPLASSYVQNLYAPDVDPQIEVEDYERTVEEEEDLGITDIKTEDYTEKEASEVQHVSVAEESAGGV